MEPYRYVLQNEDSSEYIEFGDGSIGCINYFSNGSKSFPKERLDVFSSGRVLQLDNFRKLKGGDGLTLKNGIYGNRIKGKKLVPLHSSMPLEIGASPIPIEEIFEINRISIDLQNSGC